MGISDGHFRYSIRFATPGGRLMASWLAAQYNGVLVLGTSTVFVPFLASFGPQGGPVWHHWALGPPLLGFLAHMGGPGPKVA